MNAHVSSVPGGIQRQFHVHFVLVSGSHDEAVVMGV